MSEFFKNCLMNKWMNDYDSHVKSMFHGNLDPGCCAHSITSSASDGCLADIGCIDNGVWLALNHFLSVGVRHGKWQAACYSFM